MRIKYLAYIKNLFNVFLLFDSVYIDNMFMGMGDSLIWETDLDFSPRPDTDLSDLGI